MKKNNELKTNVRGCNQQIGITLIALIITIIVMLILVGVVITVAIRGDLFSTARKAVADTKNERDKELNINSYIEELIDRKVRGITTVYAILYTDGELEFNTTGTEQEGKV